MIDGASVRQVLAEAGLTAWAALVEEQLERFFHAVPHGDWVRWRRAIDDLPSLGSGAVRCRDGALSLEPDNVPDDTVLENVAATLQSLHPWRKGPFRIADLLIDTEWRSDWKWDRVSPHLAPLAGRHVLDVGCGNGYHCWRAALDGAGLVIGIDPTAVFVAQFLAIRRLLAPMAPRLAQQVHHLPVGIEAVPAGLSRFDTVFSMGVLYHRRSPIDHLQDLRGALRPGGQLVLETLVVDGPDDRVLVPEGRYAKMRNVWFIPSTAMLETWLRRCGFTAVKTVDVTPTRVEEQRSTAWMRFESLADFLDPADKRFTIEGHPAPLRAVLIAEA